MRNTQHSEDCARHPFDGIPRHVFLDTNVVNIIVKHSEEIFDQVDVFDSINATRADDIEALRKIFFVGMRANWSIVASEKTVDEIERTRDPELRQRLLDYALQIVNRDIDDDDRRFANDFARRIVDSHFVAPLPDRNDRLLVGNAIGFGCDAFCTCDRTTIVNVRDKLKHLRLRIITPAEWWASIRPWAALWC